MVTYPEDWVTYPFETLFKLIPSTILSRNKLSEYGNVGNIHYGDVLVAYGDVLTDLDSIPRIGEGVEYRTDAFLAEGDVVIADTAEDETAGKVTQIGNVSLPLTGGLHTVVCRPLIDTPTGYLGSYMNSNFYHDQLLPYMTGIKVLSVTKKTLGKTELTLPSTRQEQQAIVDTLSQFNELIANLDELIEKKRNIREGAIQDIFSKTDNIFTTCKMASLGTIYSGISGKSKSDFGSGPSFFIPFLNVLNNVVIDSDYLERVNITGDEKQNNVKANDLFFNTSSETPEEVGLCAVLLEDINRCYLNSFCFGFRLNENAPAIPLYLSYFFNSPAGRKLMSIYAQGSTRYNLSKRRFLDIEIQLPSVMTQQEIVDDLVAMDFEIAALEEERDKMIQIRDGAMDDLLTGRVRLDFEGDNNA